MSSASRATPCQRSARAASLQSFSTTIGQVNRSLRWAARKSVITMPVSARAIGWQWKSAPCSRVKRTICFSPGSRS